jgi:hypothetical protein
LSTAIFSSSYTSFKGTSIPTLDYDPIPDVIAFSTECVSVLTFSSLTTTVS